MGTSHNNKVTKPKLKKGLVQVYTGSGKGKTTAAFGLAMRARGQGLRVSIIQFLKGGPSGEIKEVGKLGIELIRFPGPFCPGCRLSREEKSRLRRRLQRAFTRAKEIVMGGRYDLVVLDELNFVLSEGLLRTQDVLDLLREKPAHVEVILTGRYAPKSIVRRADLVTEMVEVKHPFQQGVKARKGIEY